MQNIIIADSPDEVSEAAAGLFADIANDAISQRGKFAVALAGGSTPNLLYKKLTTAAVDWDCVHFFFGDERNVPQDHEKSNFRMVNEALFHPLKIGDDKIHRWKTEIGDPEKIAAEYSDTLSGFFSGLPGFDLTLLGLGDDGHTASLFPHTQGLTEESRTAVSNWVEKLGEFRLTMTFPVINNSANIMFLVTGEAKAPILHRVIDGERLPDDLPAQRVMPADGEVTWVLDRDAAENLEKN